MKPTREAKEIKMNPTEKIISLTREAKEIKMNLEYRFLIEELISLGRELGETQLNLRKLEDDRKMVADEWKSKISAGESHVNNLANKVSSGYEYRDIPCRVTFDEPCAGQKTITREDTLAVVKICAMTESEKQAELPFEAE